MSAAIEAKLAEATVVIGFLAELEFPSGFERVWTGSWTLKTKDGRSWGPVGQWGSVTPIRTESATVSSSFTLTLTRPHFLSTGQAASYRNKLRQDWDANWRGGDASVLVQVFHPTTFAPVGAPLVIGRGRMGPMTIREDIETAEVSVTVAGMLSDGSAPPHGYVTDEDHQSRYPGDKIFEFAPQLRTRTLRWPRTV